MAFTLPYDSAAAGRVQLGPCTISFGGTDLGLTKGGVEIEVSTETYKVTVDQYGNTEINEYITGRTVNVTVPMAETDLTKLNTILPGSTIVTDGVTPTKKKLVVPSAVGTSLLSVADELICHPIALDAADKSQDFTLPVTAPKGDLSFAYKLNEERIFNVTFTGYPDLTTNVLFIIGDKTATA